MPAIVFHLHGKSAEVSGAAIAVEQDESPHAMDQLRKTVAEKLSIVLPSSVSFHKTAPAETLPAELTALENIDAILAERSVAILVSGKVRPVPGPSGGIPFIGGYSEIYPDFISNYHRLLKKYGHMAHVSYLGKDVYLTDDPDCAGLVLSEGEYYSKMIGPNHPLFPLKMSVPNGLFTADSTNPAWSTSHKFIMTAMGAKAMRNYVRTMDHTANRLIKCFAEIQSKGEAVNGFSWGMRVAGQTIGEVAVGVDFHMLDSSQSSIPKILLSLGHNMELAQTLFRRGSFYRALPNPERREQRKIETELNAFLDSESQKTLQKHNTKDMPYAEAAVSTSSLLDYMLHATDEDGKKMEASLVHENAMTFLGAGQVTTSSGLAWIWFCLATFPAQARKLYASLIAAGLRKDKDITADELAKLEYLDWFIKEVQRLYNPAIQPTRQAQKDLIMPGGYFVPKDAQVTVVLHSIMINPEHWKDPLTFDPDRWGTEEVRKRHKHAYIPFAAGGRSCIAFNFALQEMKLIIARVVLNFQIQNVTEGAVIYDPDFSLYRPLNFMMKLHKQIDPEEALANQDAAAVPAHAEEAEKVPAPQPAVGSVPLPRLWAVHASNNGTCLGMAGDVAAKARQLGFREVQVVALADSPLADAEKTKTVASAETGNFFVICVATYNGEPPDAALSYEDMLDMEVKAGNESRFAGINFCVFGAGNTQWGPTYQTFPKKVDANIAALGGNRVFEKGSGDANVDQDSDFTEWVTRLWAAAAANFGVDIQGRAAGGEGTGNLRTDAPTFGAAAVKVEFLPLASSTPDLFLSEPPVPRFVKVTLKENLELVDEETPQPRGMRLITFDVPEGFSYREGDHVEVFPENDPAVVERLLINLNFVAEAAFTVKEVGAGVNPKSLAALLLGRGPITLKELLLYYADLAGPLQHSTLQLLTSFLASDEKFKTVHDTLASATAHQTQRNFSALLKEHPVLAEVLTLQRLLIVLRGTQPRRYSVASSPLVNPRVLKLCVGVKDVRVIDRDHVGLCSGFLKRAPVGHVVWARPRAAQESFHLPTDPSIPVTMVAAGTGISAFLGFLEHRRAQGFKVKDNAPFRLYYGARYHDMPKFRAMGRDFEDDGTVLLEVVYSEEDAPRRFAQQLLTRDALRVWSEISNGGRVYVCGSAARVAEGVRRSLMSIAEQVGGVADSAAWLADLRKEERYSEDVFG